MGLSAGLRTVSLNADNLPSPEDVFVAWLVKQPVGGDLADAVDVELQRLRRYVGRHPGPARLAELFSELRRSLAPAARPRTTLQ